MNCFITSHHRYKVFFYVGNPKEDIFSGHLLKSIFQSSLHILQITIFDMLDLCGQLSCTAYIFVPSHSWSCSRTRSDIKNRGQWEQGSTLVMATDLGRVRATGKKKKKKKKFHFTWKLNLVLFIISRPDRT